MVYFQAVLSHWFVSRLPLASPVFGKYGITFEDLQGVQRRLCTYIVIIDTTMMDMRNHHFLGSPRFEAYSINVWRNKSVWISDTWCRVWKLTWCMPITNLSDANMRDIYVLCMSTSVIYVLCMSTSDIYVLRRYGDRLEGRRCQICFGIGLWYPYGVPQTGLTDTLECLMCILL